MDQELYRASGLASGAHPAAGTSLCAVAATCSPFACILHHEVGQVQAPESLTHQSSHAFMRLSLNQYYTIGTGVVRAAVSPDLTHPGMATCGMPPPRMDMNK
jgi:hypothetical protein